MNNYYKKKYNINKKFDSLLNFFIRVSLQKPRKM